MSDIAPVKEPAKVFQPPALSLTGKGAYSRQARMKQESKQREMAEKLQMEKMLEKAKLI